MAWMSYATVGSNSLEAAKAFYDALLIPVGIGRLYEHPSGGRVYGARGQPNFAVLGPYDGQPASVGNGCMIAFSFDTRAEVDAFHAKGLELGGADEGAPAVRGPAVYFSYFRDLDGNKLCAYCMT
jgi:catechol 2,3-dioxygenase-like lactoylglutathione lyase family enzyme